MAANNYGDLSGFYSLQEWNSISEYEKKRNFNLLENYRTMIKFGFKPPKPDFMCVNKRKMEENNYYVVNKKTRIKFNPPLKNSDVQAIAEPVAKDSSKLSDSLKNKKSITLKKPKNAWRYVPTTDELAQEIDVDFLGFSEEDATGQVVGLKELTQAIDKIHTEIKSLEKSAEEDEPKKSKATTTGRRYPKRSVPRKDYTEEEVPDDDDYIFCDDCNCEWEGDCPVHGPLQIVEDTKVPQNSTDQTRADRTIPPQLCIAQSKIPHAGRGVWTRVPLVKGIRFGPYEGAIVEYNNANGYGWQIRRNRRPSHCVDAKDCGLANWMRYVNCARHEEEQNLMAFQYKGQMYYRTTTNIPPHMELLVWYGDGYGRELGIDVDNFHNPQYKHSNSGFCCSLCNIRFTSPVYLEKHVKYCRARRQVYSIVTIATNNNRSFQRYKYLNENTGERRYQCEYEISVRSNIVDHMRTHTRERPYKCNKCDYSASEHISLVNHMRTHTGERPYQCDKCDYRSSRHIDLVRHMRTHTGERPYPCDKCDYSASEHISLVRHMRAHTGERPYQCDKCNYRASQQNSLVIHMRVHTGEKPYQCDKCEYRTSRHPDLVKHMRTHTGEKPYQCDKCDYRASRHIHLVNHMRTHTGEKPYQCDKCDYRASQHIHLVNHMRTHTGEKPYQCDKCDYKASRHIHLVIHMRTHTGEKPYQCDKCDYRASQHIHLVKHMRTHTGEKPYQCDKCDYKASQHNHLVNHMRTHTGEKPYQCDKCDYRASVHSSLVNHMRTHTGERPYQCDKCNYRASHYNSLVRHMRTHIGEIPIQTY